MDQGRIPLGTEKGEKGGREREEGRLGGSGTAGDGGSLKVGESKRRQNTREKNERARERETETVTESNRDRERKRQNRDRDSVCVNEIHEIERGGGTRISPGRESWPGSPSSPRAAGPFPAEFAGWVYSHMLMRQKPVRRPACAAPGPAGQAAVEPGARPALRGPSRWPRGGHAPRPAGAARLVSAVQRHS
jgi:hypothetical protein